MKDELRIIKKYPNRRLYDTAISSYITLDSIKTLVNEGTEFKVIDARSEQDITDSTLLQIIIDQEDSQPPLFTRQLLLNFIRFYGNSMQTVMSQYLEQSMDLFLNQQNNLQSSLQTWFKDSPLQSMTALAHKNLQIWQDMQNKFMQSNQQHTPTKQAAEVKEPEKSDA